MSYKPASAFNIIATQGQPTYLNSIMDKRVRAVKKNKKQKMKENFGTFTNKITSFQILVSFKNAKNGNGTLFKIDKSSFVYLIKINPGQSFSWRFLGCIFYPFLNRENLHENSVNLQVHKE